MFQKMKEKLGVKLINNDAKKYQNFLKDFSLTSGESLYNGNLKDIHNSNFLISVGSYLKSDAPNVRYAFNNAITMNKGAGLYFHPMGDITVEGFGKKGKNIETIYHKVGAEEAVLYFILDQFGNDLPEDTASYLESFKETRTKTVTETIKEKVTETVVDAETGEEKEVTKMVPKKVSKDVEYTYTKLLDLIGAQELLLETIETMLDKKDTFSLVVGQDVITHAQSSNLAKLCGLVQKYTNFKVVIIPTETNTLGVSLICDLDDTSGTNVVGYNKAGNFQLSALGDGDLDMPALNQQEGTFVNIDKRVVPTNAAMPYNGYVLNDIANIVLDIDEDELIEYTIDYTKDLFEGVEFDKLCNYFSNDFKEHRGYELKSQEVSSSNDVSQIAEIKEVEGTVIYKANPINQFNEFTALAKQFENDSKVALYVSNDLLAKLELNQGDKVSVEANSESLELDVVVDKQISGDIAYVPYFDKSVSSCKLFDGYRYSNANIKKV